MDINKEKEYRIVKLKSTKWNEAMKILKQFNYEADKKHFIMYKDNCKGEEKRSCEIKTVYFVDETNSYSFNDGDLILKDIEINSLDIQSNNKQDLSEYMIGW